MRAWADEDDKQQPGETRKEWQERMKRKAEQCALHRPGGYYSTKNADGSSRGGAAEMFERYGFF